MTVRDLVNQPLPARRPAMEPRHIGLGPGLVDEDEAAGLDAGLISHPCSNRRIRPRLDPRAQRRSLHASVSLGRRCIAAARKATPKTGQNAGFLLIFLATAALTDAVEAFEADFHLLTLIHEALTGATKSLSHYIVHRHMSIVRRFKIASANRAAPRKRIDAHE
jgi:hypothetical protein